MMRFIVAAVIFLAAMNCKAEEVAPSFYLGDSWTYAFTEDGEYRFDYGETVTDVQGDIVSLMTVDSKGRRSVSTYDRRLHRYLVRYRVRGADPSVRAGVIWDISESDPPIKFPFEVGASWPVYNKVRDIYGNDIHRQMTARVLGRETISVPAGEFEVYKIELVGVWRVVAHVAGKYVETYWYSPRVKRFVKRELRSYGDTVEKTAAAIKYHRIDELKSYSLAN